MLQELERYSGQNTIEGMQANNCPGYLVPQPLLRTINSYDSVIAAKSSSFIDNMVNNIAKSTSCRIPKPLNTCFESCI
jgi:hypothetical protein